MKHTPGPEVQSVVSPTADPRVMSLIPFVYSKHMLKLMDMKMITILFSIFVSYLDLRLHP